MGGKVFLTKTNIAFSAPSLILFRTTYTNCPTVKSAGTRYLQSRKEKSITTSVKSSNNTLQASNCLIAGFTGTKYMDISIVN